VLGSSTDATKEQACLPPTVVANVGQIMCMAVCTQGVRNSVQ